MKIYLVGGAVRDQLLNFPFSERDWVVVGSTPEEMIQLGYRPVGKDFPVFLHPETNEEYALARTERKTAPGYKGFTFHTDRSVSLEDDLARRDLTINAIAQDDKGNLIDPYHGQRDIENGYLRHVSMAFTEDPVRILRIARFKARYHYLDFKIAKDTLKLMTTMVNKGETQHLVAERVWQELKKALDESTPAQFFITLIKCGVYRDILNEFTTTQLELGIQLLETITTQTKLTELRFAALVYPLSLEAIQTLCDRLGAPNNFKAIATLLKKYKEHIIKPTQVINIEVASLAETLQGLDALRKQDRFYAIISGMAYLFYEKNPQVLIHFWGTALQYYQQVNPQELINQGYKHSKLGEAINQQRTKQLTLFLSEYKREF